MFEIEKNSCAPLFIIFCDSCFHPASKNERVSAISGFTEARCFKCDDDLWRESRVWIIPITGGQIYDSLPLRRGDSVPCQRCNSIVLLSDDEKNNCLNCGLEAKVWDYAQLP